MATRDDFLGIAQRIWHDLRADGFRGTDPYDGLNSRLLGPLLNRSRLFRLLVIQGVKRSPVDLRPFLGIPRGLNPKGLALMLQGAAEFEGLGASNVDQRWLGDALLSMASDVEGKPVTRGREIQPGLAMQLAAGSVHWPVATGWGYDFPWQSKAFLQPAFFPTVVATSFVLDALELADSEALPMAARSAGNFVYDSLHRYEDRDGICFSYSPGDHTRVYNASLFGARILAQAAIHAPDMSDRWREASHRAVNWVMARQTDDGSWIYGEAGHWQWIDNLHTGFNLEAIARIAHLLNTDEWDVGLDRGLAYYRRFLFEGDGTAKYYTTSRWPLDPHSFAQGALTFLRLRRFDSDAVHFSGRILVRGIEELWDEKHGGFKFQKHRYYTQPSIHMRWSQAWMFRALSAYLAASSPDSPATSLTKS